MTNYHKFTRLTISLQTIKFLRVVAFDSQVYPPVGRFGLRALPPCYWTGAIAYRYTTPPPFRKLNAAAWCCSNIEQTQHLEWETGRSTHGNAHALSLVQEACGLRIFTDTYESGAACAGLRGASVVGILTLVLPLAWQ